MYSILNSLYISSVEVASQTELLNKACIKAIVSIGCEIGDKSPAIDYLSFPHILDTPETNIIDIVHDTNAFIHKSLSKSESVLVHCVYGQSRSATVIISYLLYTGMTLSDAIDLMKAKNPTTCINPGFLAQMYFMSVLPRHSVEHSFIKVAPVEVAMSCRKESAVCVGTKRRLINAMTESNPLDSEASITQENTVICRKCKAELASSSDILTRSIDPTAFVKAHEDGFWHGYRPNRSKTLNAPVVLPEKGHIAMYPSPWMVDQVQTHREKCGLGDKHVVPTEGSTLSGDECELICPSCSSLVGIWRSKSLNLIGIYNLCDLYAFKCEFARVKKVRQHPCL